MTTTCDTAAYCAGDLGPDNIQKYLPDIQQSGLTTAILWAVHIGRPSIAGQKYGDLIFNTGSNLFVSEGAFNPLGSSTIAAWPQQVAQLKQSGSVERIFFSIGGAVPWVADFTTIQYMLANGMTNVLVENFTTLKNVFSVDGACVIDGFDLDCEEYVDEGTIVSLSQILFDLGFEVTFCPFTNAEWWQSCMQTLWNKGHKVSWWNLQCYAGGYGNDPVSWIKTLAAVVGKADAASYLMPGLAVAGSESDGQCPTGSGSIESTFAGWSSLGLRGGFLWSYDSIQDNSGKGLCSGSADLAAYVSAIDAGLNGASKAAAAPSRAPEPA